MKEIQLTQGKVALVDDADYEWLNQWKWFAYKNRGKYYAARGLPRKSGIKRQITMHRQILGLEYGDRRQGDHRNHITLDNQRDNLRICTLQQNQHNQQPQQNTSSQYKGVYWTKNVRKWQARIKVNEKRIYLGIFDNERTAALTYNLAAKKYFGKFAFLNKIG